MILMQIFSPLILIVGIIGNAMNLYIFTRTSLKGLSTFRVLAYLSFIDALFIIIGMPHIIINVYYNDYDFRSTTNLVCSIHSFLTIYLSHLSSYIQAAVGLIRCVSVASSHPKNNNISVEILVLTITIILFLIDGHFIIWMRLSDQNDFIPEDLKLLNDTFVDKKICTPSPIKQPLYYKFIHGYWVHIDMFLYSYIPFLIMIISTICICKRLFKITQGLRKTLKVIEKRSQVEKERCPIRKQELDEKEPNDCLNIHNAKTGDASIRLVVKSLNKQTQANIKIEKKTLLSRRLQNYNKIYRLLLCLNLVFFLLVSPLVICNSLSLLKNDLLRDVVYVFSYLNHCLNSFIYGMSCEIYRNILFNILHIQCTTELI